MAFHLSVDWSGHGFVVDVMRSRVRKHPFRRRVAYRNSAVRQDVSGHCHFERWWWRGWDIALHWGQYDPAQPPIFYNPEQRKWLPKGQ